MAASENTQDALLDLVLCPETRQGLNSADDALVARLNAEISAGTLLDASGKPRTKPIDGALVRDDKKVAYPIYDGIPCLVMDQRFDIA